MYAFLPIFLSATPWPDLECHHTRHQGPERGLCQYILRPCNLTFAVLQSTRGILQMVQPQRSIEHLARSYHPPTAQRDCSREDRRQLCDRELTGHACVLTLGPSSEAFDGPFGRERIESEIRADDTLDAVRSRPVRGALTASSEPPLLRTWFAAAPASACDDRVHA
jgi:hypothetical protein